MVELLIVLGVSTAIAVASFPKLKAKADGKIAERAAEEATNWLIAARAFRQDFGAWPASAQDLIDNGYMDASALDTPFQSNYSLSVNGNNIQVSIDTGSAKFAKLLSGSSLPSVAATGNVITAEVPAPGLEVALEAYLPRDGSRAMTGDLDAGNNNITNYGAAGHTLTTSDAQTTQIQSADANASSVEVATSDGVGRGSLVGTNGNTVGIQTSSGDWGVRSNDGGNTIISANGADILTVSPTAATVNGDMASTNAIVDEWFTNNSANRGIRNNTTGRMLYADSAGDWVMAGGGSTNRLMFRDTFGGAARGGLRANNDNSVGLVDAGGHWGVRHRNDQGTYFYDSNNTERFRVGPSGVSGSFGTVETRGGGKGGYAGYSIGGEIVFMANPTNQAFGIYNDLNNQWAFLGKMGAEASIYYNGSPKLSTTNTGVAVNGNTDTTGAFLFGGNNLLLGQRTPTTARLRSASGTQSGLRLEGSGNNALGELFADGNNFGLRDSSLNWALRHEKGLYTAFAENGSESLRIGAGGVTGDFGTLQTYGSGKGGFSGYSIAGEAGLFRDDGTGIFGLYDDANDNWALRATPTGATELGFGNSFKLTTSGTGVDINGNLVASSKLSAYNGALELRNNGIYFESGNHAITWNDGKGNFNLRVGHSPAEKITEAGWAYHQSFLQSNGTITWRLSGASGAVGDDITWATNLTLNPNGVLALNGDRIYGVSEYENRYINATGDTMTGTLNSTVATGTKIFSFASNGSGSMLKRISNQGGLQLSADSSLLLYAGDAHDTLAGDIGITPTGTGEEVYIAADSTIRFFTDLQNGYAGSHRMIFDANGNLTVDGALVMNRSNDGQGSLFDADYIDGLDSKQLMSWGGAFSGNWDDRIDEGTGEIHFNDIHDTSSGAHTNFPANAYKWGGLLSYRGQYSSFQLYAPHQGSNTDDLWYRTGWNGSHFGWQRILTTANMGSGSGINADMVDGLHASSLLRSDANDTATGALTFAGSTTFTGNIGTNGMANPGVMVGVSSGNDGQIQITGANPHIDFANGQEDYDVRIVRSADDILDIQGVANTGLRVNGSQVWTAATDGPGSGLAADTLDNLNSTQFLRSDTADIASGLITFNAGIKLGSNQALIHNTTSTRDKIRLWSSSEYAIGMQNNFNYGGLSNNYAMTFQMSNTTARGFWWGDSAHAQGQGAMALTTDGRLTVARAMRLGFGEGDNVTPGSLGVLEINGNSNFSGNISASGFIRTTGQLIADEMRSIGNSSSIIDLGYDPIASNAIGISTNNTVAVNFDTNNNNTGSLAFVVGHNGEYGSADYEELLRVAGDTTFTYKGNNVFHAGYMGAGTGLDADKVDGLHGYQFLRSDIADVKSGVLTMAESDIKFRLNGFGSGWARGAHWLVPDGTANEYGVGVLGNGANSNYLYFGSGPSPWSTYALKVNKGSRTVDFGAGANFANNVTIQYAGSPGLELRSSNGGSPYLDFSNDGSIDHDARIQLTGDDVLAITGVNSTNGFTVNGYKVFHTGNDGSGSGLNADLFDGLNSTAFLRSNADDSFSGTITGAKLYLGGSPILAGSSAALQVNGFMRTGNIMLHDGGNTPTGSGKVLGSNSGALTWDGQTVYHDSYHPVADQWTTARTMTLAGDLTGSATFDGSSNFSVSVQVKNDSHTHDGRYYTEAEADGRFLNASGDTSTGMRIFHSPLSNESDWANSPISIRERGAAGPGTGDDAEAPNINFHWANRNSQSLWMAADGSLNYGGYSNAGVPNSAGVIRASTFDGNLTGNAATASKWDNPITLSTSGDTTGAVSFDGSSNVNLNLQVQNDSHSHQFANLTGKTAGTGDYATTGDLVSGKGSGGVALTVNDGYGNANITFNHQDGKPEQNGNAARIEFNADSTSNPMMYFELGENVSANTATALTETLRLTLNEVTFKGYKMMHTGNDGAGSNFDADKLDGLNSSQLLRSDANDVFTGTITGNKLYLGGSPISSGSSAVLQVNGFMRTGNIYIHEGGGTPTTTSLALANSGGNLIWDGQRIYHDNYHPTADKWTTARTLTLAGDLTGNTTFDGSGNFTLTAQVQNDSHTHDGRYYTESEADGRFFRFLGTGGDADSYKDMDGYVQGRAFTANHPTGASHGTMLVAGKHTSGDIQIFVDDTGRLFTRSNSWDDVWSPWHKYVSSETDGAGSGFDADYLDGLDSTQFLRSDQDDTLNGALTINNSATIGQSNFANGSLKIGAVSQGLALDSNEIFATNGLLIGTSAGNIDLNPSGIVKVNGSRVFTDSYRPRADRWTTARTLTLGGDLTGNVSFNGASNFTLTANVKNDSHTHDGRYFTESESNNLFTSKVATKLGVVGSTSDNITDTEAEWSNLPVGYSSFMNQGIGVAGGLPENSFGYFTKVSNRDTAGGWGGLWLGHGSAGDYIGVADTNADFATWRELWTSRSDGAGSGLDADLLDGLQATKFFRNDVANQTTRWDRVFAGSTGQANAKYGNDTAGLANLNNLSIGTWYGFSIHPTISGQAVDVDTPAFSVNARNGNVYAAGNIFEQNQALSSRYLGLNATAANADKLDGQHGAFYQNASNLNAGIVPVARLSGTYDISVSGNAATATRLATARTINGVSFNGTSNITVNPYVERDDASNANRYLAFVDNNTAGFKRLNMDTNLVWNPSTNTLTASGSKFWNAANDGSGSGLSADNLDGINSSSFLRSDANDSFSGDLVSTSRNKGIFGTYDSTKTDQIWSMGTSFRNSADGSDFGNLYGLAYKHTNNPTGGAMAGGHQMVWVANGSPKSAMGTNIWTSGSIYENSQLLSARYLGKTAKAADSEMVDGYDSTKLMKYDGIFTGNWNTLVDQSAGEMSFVQINNHADGNHTNQPTASYTYGGLLSYRAGNAQMQLYASHHGSNYDGLFFRTGWTNDRKPWQKILTTADMGSGSGIDADKLDGLNSSQFLRADANDVATGQIRIQPSANIGLTTYTNGGLLIGNASSGIAIDADEIFSTGNLYLKANSGNLVMSSTGNFTHNGNQVYTAAYHPLADKWSQARSISLNGDATGTVSLDGSSNVSMTVAVANDSHTHDTRYYTKAQADARYLPIGGKAADSNQLDGIDSTGFQRLNYIDTSNQYLFRHRNSSSAVLYANQTGSGDIARFYKGAAAGDTSGASYVTLKNNGDIISSGSLDVNGALTFGTSNHRISQVNSSRISYRSGHAANAQIELRTSENEYAGGLYGSETSLSIRNQNANSIVYGDGGTTYIYADGQAGIQISKNGKTALRYNNSEKLRTTSTGAETVGTHLADRITDRNNTGYYLDMNSISRLGDLRADVIKDPNDTAYYLDLNSRSVLNEVYMTSPRVVGTATPGASCPRPGHLSRTDDGALLECYQDAFGNDEWRYVGSELYNSSGPKVVAHVNYDGDLETPRRVSGNIQSFNRLGSGSYEVIFNTGYPNVDYTVLCSFTANGGGAVSKPHNCMVYDVTASSFKFQTRTSTGGSGTNSVNGLHTMLTVIR